ncbi:MAG: TonB-dependent receptor [bacterium]|nr:TonB-dependent receptor [bacterium]
MIKVFLKTLLLILLSVSLSSVVFAQAVTEDKLVPGDDLSGAVFPREDEELSFFELEDLLGATVTTASRSARSIRDLPVTIHVITRKEILNNNYVTLVDALKDYAGIRVSQPGSGIEGETFTMRGLFGNYYTKFLVNGMPITPSVVSGLPIGDQINMKNVDRIEIINGPASALYGADAVAGVINIITFAPKENMVRVETRNKIDTHGNFGTYNNAYAAFSVGEDESRVQFIVYGLYSKLLDQNITGGYDDVYRAEEYGGVTGTVGDSNNITGRFKDLPRNDYSFGTQILFWDFTLSYDYMYRSQHSSIGQVTNLYYYDSEDAIWGETIQRVALQHTVDVGKMNFKSNLSYLRYRMDNDSYFNFTYASASAYKAYKYQASDDILFEEVIVWNVLKSLEMVGGISFQYSGALPQTNDLTSAFTESNYSPFSTNKLPSDAFFGDFGNNPLTYYNIAGFLQAAYSTDMFNIMAGGRFDYHSKYDYTANPRVAGQFNFSKDTSVRASFGMAFKAPAPYYAYHSIASNNGGLIQYVDVPNPNLEPEKLTSYELGFRHLLNKAISLEIVGYLNLLKNMISTTTIAGSTYPGSFNDVNTTTITTYSNDNSAKATVIGVDGIVHIRNIVEAIKLSSDIYLSFIKGWETLPSSNGDIDNLRMSPLFSGKVRISAVPVKGLYVGIDNIYFHDWYARRIKNTNASTDTDSYNNPDNKHDKYFVMDVILSYEIIQNFKIHSEVNNVFDAKYAGIDAYPFVETLKYNPQTGRNFYGGLEYTLKF